jgi:high affinity sulfate transporter 1
MADRLSSADTITVDPREWAAPRPSGVRRVLPILAWLPAYDRKDTRFDLIAGATLWGLLVPESIAYAGLAGLPPEAGLYTLLATLAAYVVFGTSRHLVVAATSASAVLLATAVASVGPVNGEAYAANASAVVLFCAGLLLLAGVLRLGFIAQFLSRPVMEGFVFGLAIFVTIKQLPKLFGIAKGEGNSLQQLAHLLTHLDETSAVTLAVGVAALVLLVAAERYAPRLPGGLLALALGIGISSALKLAEHGVAIVGPVPSGLPSVGVPDIASQDVATLMAAAAGMALVIFSESLGAAQAFATKYGYEIDPNQELVALGAANAGSGVVGGLAGGGSLSQSAVNEGAGARSEVSPLFASVLILVTLLFLTPLFKTLPEAVLAALIIHAVSRLWKFKQFRLYYREQPIECWLGIATLAGVTLIDVLPGLLIGVVAMLLLVIYNASRPHLGVLGAVPGVPDAYGDVERHPDYHRVPDLLIVRVEAALFYANANLVRDHIKKLVGASDPLPRAVVLELTANAGLDITSAEMLEQLIKTLHSAGIDVALADLRQPVVDVARRTGLLETLGEDRLFLTLADAVRTMGSTLARETLTTGLAHEAAT